MPDQERTAAALDLHLMVWRAEQRVWVGASCLKAGHEGGYPVDHSQAHQHHDQRIPELSDWSA